MSPQIAAAARNGGYRVNRKRPAQWRCLLCPTEWRDTWEDPGRAAMDHYIRHHKDKEAL